MAEVVRQLSERLVTLGHSVTVATEYCPNRPEKYMNGVKIVSFVVGGNAVNGIYGEVASYKQFLLESSFDIMVNFAAQQWATDIVLPLLPQISCRKVFVPTGFSGLFSNNYKDYFRLLPGYMQQYDMNVFHSNCYRDIEFARSHGVDRITVIPNGAASDEFLGPMTDMRAQLGIPRNHFIVLHVGSHTGLKGHAETIEIFRNAAIQHATLLIVGNDLPGGCGSSCREKASQLNLSMRFKAEGKQIIIAMLPRSETVSAYDTADVFLFPSNIECSPIVLFECMASRTPFLVTDAGNSAEIIDWSGGAGVLLPSVAMSDQKNLVLRFAEKIKIALGRGDDFRTVRANINDSVVLFEALYHDIDRRKKMAKEGFTSWEKRFTWEKIAVDYEKLYQSILGR